MDFSKSGSAAVHRPRSASSMPFSFAADAFSAGIFVGVCAARYPAAPHAKAATATVKTRKRLNIRKQRVDGDVRTAHYSLIGTLAQRGLLLRQERSGCFVCQSVCSWKRF